jgi:hypothetical protein
MTQRRRNAILILVCGTLIFVLPYLRPELRVSPFGWDWRTVEEGPFAGAPVADAEQAVALRILDGPDAAWTAELLWSTGALDVRVGSPASHAGADDEVWLLPAGDCASADAALEHVTRGGPLITWSDCPALLEGLGLPTPVPWSQEGAVGQVDGQPALRTLALPDAGGEWQQALEGVGLTVHRAQGGLVAVERGPVLAWSFDLAGWLLRLRQGEAEWIGFDRDGDGRVTPTDLRPFPWASPTWRTPSVDLWAELVVHGAGRLRARPLDRLWPLPTEAPSALVLTTEQADADPERIGALLALVEQRKGEATILLGEELPDGRSVRLARDWGHGLALQPDGVDLGSPQEVAALVRQVHADSAPALQPAEVRALRMRQGQWWGFDAPARLFAELGLWVELGHVSRSERHRGAGFGFGSARPLRYRGTDGALLPLLSWPTTIVQGRLPAEQALLGARNLLDEATRHRLPLVADVAPPGGAGDEGLLLLGLLDEAAMRGLPVIGAERAATWAWDHRRRVSGHGPGDPAVPQLLWQPGGDCPHPVSPSVLEPPGCLEPGSSLPQP